MIHDSVAKHDFGESNKNPYLIPIQRNIFFLIFRILKIFNRIYKMEIPF